MEKIYTNMKRIKGDMFPCGHLNIPYGKSSYLIDHRGFICFVDEKGNHKTICLETSEFAYTNFAYDADDRGVDRFELINKNIEVMSKIFDKDRYFAEFFHDGIAMKYKKNDNPDEWTWNRLAVHKAPISDLEHILELVKDMYKRARADYPDYYDKYGNIIIPH